VRILGGSADVEHTWAVEYGGTGNAPVAWIDKRGYMAVNADRVDVPFSANDSAQGPIRR
jgi:hypothetical protein